MKLNKVQLILPYSRKQDMKLITKMKLSTKFCVKDKTDLYHEINLVYYGKCPLEACAEDYIGETVESRKE